MIVRPARWRAHLLILGACLSCADHPTPPGGGARLVILAQGSSDVAPAIIQIEAAYYRGTNGTAPLTVSPSTITLSAANEFDQRVDIGIYPCLVDVTAARVTQSGTESGCFLSVVLKLRDLAGTLLDSVDVGPSVAITQASTLSMGPVNLGGASAIVVSPPSGLAAGDSVQLVTTPRTRTGRGLDAPVTFATTDASIATVSATGRVIARGYGTALLLVSAAGRTDTVSFTVRPRTEAEATTLATATTQLWNAANGGVVATAGGGESLALLGGMLADEWLTGDTFIERDEVDARNVSATNTVVANAYKTAVRARRLTQLSISASTNLLSSSPNPNAVRVSLSEMFTRQGLSEVMIAETFCAGTAFTDIDPTTAKTSFGPAETTNETLLRAVASFDNAVTHATAAGAAAGAPAAMLAARAARARAYLALGRNAEALADASTVPLAFTFTAAFTGVTGDQNGAWFMNHSRRGYSVAELQGTNGLPFRTAGDPRLVVTASGLSFDNVTPLFLQQRYATANTPLSVLSGTEAAFIRAEARVATGDVAGAVAEVNAVRTPLGLPPLSVVPNFLNIIMSERAFSLWGTGTRLGDLRRLIRIYGSSAATVFPTGATSNPGNSLPTFGTDVNLPISDPGESNPNYRGCLNRAA